MGDVVSTDGRRVSQIFLSNLVQTATFQSSPEGPIVTAYRRGPDSGRIQLAKVAEKHHCPRRTGEIYVSLPRLDRDWSDAHDSAHPYPGSDIRLEIKLPGGWKELDGFEEISFNYDLGFTYCMTAVEGDLNLDLGRFGKKDPVASFLTLDQMQFAILAGYSLATHLQIEQVAVVHGMVRYLDHEARYSELRGAATLQTIDRSHAGIEATFIKEDKPEFTAQNEYRFLFLCDRKGRDATKVPMNHTLRNENHEPIELWVEP